MKSKADISRLKDSLKSLKCHKTLFKIYIKHFVTSPNFSPTLTPQFPSIQIVVSNSEDPTDKGDFKMVPPMVSKPKLSGTEMKKHRTEMRPTDPFVNVFGNPMTLPAKVSPDNKRSQSDKLITSKTMPDKSEKVEKPIKSKHSPHKDKKKEKSGDERKDKKDRSIAKEKDRAKEKSKRPPSPVVKEDFTHPTAKKLCLPPPPPVKKDRASPTPPPPVIQKAPSPKPREKDHKKITIDKVKDEKDKVKETFKVPVEDQKSDRKKKKHKDDKSKDRKEKDKDKDHEKSKDSLKKSEKKIVKPEKHEKSEKDKSLESKVPKDEKKSPKHSKEKEKVRIEKADKNDAVDKPKDSRSDKEKQKHKHKKKDKKDRNEEAGDKEKQEKTKKSSDKKSSYSASPSVNPLSALIAEMPERDSSDSAPSIGDDSPPPTKSFSTNKMEVDPPIPPILASETAKPTSPRGTGEKNESEDRSRKEKTKSNRGEDRDSRRRKRKGDQDEHSAKRSKDSGHSVSPSVEPVSSSQSPISNEIEPSYNFKETTASTDAHRVPESEQVAPDSTNNSLIEPETEGALVFSDDYVSQLKDLQQKIMTLQDNVELQRVVHLIAETGQYEITRKTFDFDLCALDRRTVQRLQQFFSGT